jgi:hypothetical protein
MKTFRTKLLVFNVALAALAGLLAGCASKGYEKGAATGQALQAAADKINQGITQIDVTLTALTNLVNNPKGDLVPRFNKYSDEVKNLKSLSVDVNDKATAMQAKGQDYFAAWNQQLAMIKNQDIKQRSADQLKAVTDKFKDISNSYQEVKTRFKPFMSDLEDIQTYLGTDLTDGGVSAIRKTADKVNDEAGPLKESITKLSDQFRQLGLSMSSTGAAQGQSQK